MDGKWCGRWGRKSRKEYKPESKVIGCLERSADMCQVPGHAGVRVALAPVLYACVRLSCFNGGARVDSFSRLEQHQTNI